MPPKVIVSYDDTPNDQDAVALGRRLREAGATVSLAYVRHSRADRWRRGAARGARRS